MTPIPQSSVGGGGDGDVCFDTLPLFVLDIAFFSSIIYIWYEGYLLRPPVVRQ